MVFSDTTNKQGLIQDIDFHLFGTSVGTSAYLIADKTRNINSWYDRVVTLILQADNRWEWDDVNKTDLPIGTMALVANQLDYELSGVTFLKLLKVEVKDQSGNWNALTPISLDDKRSESITDYKKTAGTPVEYDKLGNSIFLYPKSNYGQDASLKFFYQRNVTHFTVSDTGAVPGFIENFHRILSYGAAFDYAVANGMNGKMSILAPLIAKFEDAIINFYSNRQRDEKTVITLLQENFGQDTETDDLSDVSVS